MNTYNNKYDILGSTIQPNPVSVKYWADLQSNPYGGDLKYFDGKKWCSINDSVIRATEEKIKQTNDRIDTLIGEAPDILDTLPELIEKITKNEEDIKTINTTLSTDYSKDVVDGVADGDKAWCHNHQNGGSLKYVKSDGKTAIVSVDGQSDVFAQIAYKDADKEAAERNGIIVNENGAFYLKHKAGVATTEKEEITTKKDLEDLYDYPTVAPVDAEQTVLGKQVKHLQADIKIKEDNTIGGTLKKVTDFTGFSENEKEGYFIVLKFTAPEGVTLYGEVTNSDSGRGPVKIDNDGIFVVKIKNKFQMILIHAFRGKRVTTSYYRLEEITLQETADADA